MDRYEPLVQLVLHLLLEQHLQLQQLALVQIQQYVYHKKLLVHQSQLL